MHAELTAVSQGVPAPTLMTATSAVPPAFLSREWDGTRLSRAMPFTTYKSRRDSSCSHQSLCRAGDYVHLTTDPESQAWRAIGFSSIAGFPQVQGVIDCTHVTIKALAGQPAEYVNRKGFYSINVQLVCDQWKCFMQICSHFPGSCHDAFVLCQSQLPLLFTELAQMEGWLLGDKGYPLQTWLLIPVRQPTIAAEEGYNVSHGATRATIEQAIGMLKMCFCCVNRSGAALHYEPDRIALIFAVCCALHNYANKRGEALQDEERYEQDSSSDAEDLQQERRMGGLRAARRHMQGEQ
ncbi:putative nuclease HARBI1 [Heterodontus francisci]|uniref:putative nuclease HARBI1 n=1 Tax=Heterodontus francisci TaxID=7792 RepID=UPI00355B2C8A